MDQAGSQTSAQLIDYLLEDRHLNPLLFNIYGLPGINGVTGP
jgi:hypothetical protein